jgi:hypothetical protein
MAWSPSSRPFAGALAAFSQRGSRKWTCAFQNAAATVAPWQSMTLAPSGTVTSLRDPTAMMRSPSTTRTPSGMAGASGAGRIVPPTYARLLPGGAALFAAE